MRQTLRKSVRSHGPLQYFKSLENYHHVRKIKWRGWRLVVGANQFIGSFYCRFYRKRQMKIELAVKFARGQMVLACCVIIGAHRTFIYERVLQSVLGELASSKLVMSAIVIAEFRENSRLCREIRARVNASR